MKETDPRGSSPEENCGGLKVRPRSRCSYSKICYFFRLFWMKFREIEEPASDLGKEASGVDNWISVWIKGFGPKMNF